MQFGSRTARLDSCVPGVLGLFLAHYHSLFWHQRTRLQHEDPLLRSSAPNAPCCAQCIVEYYHTDMLNVSEHADRTGYLTIGDAKFPAKVLALPT